MVTRSPVPGGNLMGIGFPAFLTSMLLFRADQNLFGMPSDFLAGLLLIVGVVSFRTGLAVAARSRRHDPL